MHFSTVLLPALASLAASTPILARDELDTRAANSTLQPWLVTAVDTHSPSGRPGNSPFSTMNITISDPNTIPAGQTPTGTAIFPPSTANCSIQWDASKNQNPYRKVTLCASDNQYGNWTFEVLKANDTNASPTEDFEVKFKLVDYVRIPGSVQSRTYVGQQKFGLWDNMRGTCGASGVCNWWLKEEVSPVMVSQKRQACTGNCGK